MSPPLRGGQKPETKIQNALIRELRIRGWHVMVTHGNAYQCGFPDLYICHPNYGARWVEVKVRDKYRFTKAQLEHFHKMTACGVGIWVLTGSDKSELDKLMRPANWTFYLSIMKAGRKGLK